MQCVLEHKCCQCELIEARNFLYSVETKIRALLDVLLPPEEHEPEFYTTLEEQTITKVGEILEQLKEYRKYDLN